MQINLGPDRDEPLDRYHHLMNKSAPSTVAPTTPGPHVAVIVDQFFGLCQEHWATDTYAW